jgi:hypothetical protein
VESLTGDKHHRHARKPKQDRYSRQRIRVQQPRGTVQGGDRGAVSGKPDAECYIWLRCTELEAHMCTGTGKVLQRGIGVFKMAEPASIKEEKTEYISTIPNHFHPIWKLEQLTFRFTMGSKSNVENDFKVLVRPPSNTLHDPYFLANSFKHSRNGAISWDWVSEISNATPSSLDRKVARNSATFISIPPTLLCQPVASAQTPFNALLDSGG